MLLEAAYRFNIDLSASWMIGDSAKDVEAGKRAGCRTVRLITDAVSADGSADIVAPCLLAAIPAILEPQSQASATAELEPQTRS